MKTQNIKNITIKKTIKKTKAERSPSKTATSPFINSSIKTKRFILLFILITSFVSLNACVSDGAGVENTSTVTDLEAIPGGNSVILTWTNPDVKIAAIDISYRIIDSETGTEPNTEPNTGSETGD